MVGDSACNKECVRQRERERERERRSVHLSHRVRRMMRGHLMHRREPVEKGVRE